MENNFDIFNIFDNFVSAVAHFKIFAFVLNANGSIKIAIVFDDIVRLNRISLFSYLPPAF